MDYVIDHPSPTQRAICMAAYRKALRAGEIVRAETCAWCDSTAHIEGHHPDYARPLMVVWLCRTCHRAHHKEYWMESQLFTGEQTA